MRVWRQRVSRMCFRWRVSLTTVPSLGTISSSLGGIGQGQTLLSSTTLCCLSYSASCVCGSGFICFLSSSFGWVDQGSYIPLGFLNVTHQKLGVFSSQLQNKLPAVMFVSFVGTSCMPSWNSSISFDCYDNLTAATWLEGLHIDLQSFRLKKESIWAACYQTSHPHNSNAFFFPEAYLCCVKTVHGIVTGLWPTHCWVPFPPNTTFHFVSADGIHYSLSTPEK